MGRLTDSTICLVWRMFTRAVPWLGFGYGSDCESLPFPFDGKLYRMRNAAFGL